MGPARWSSVTTTGPQAGVTRTPTLPAAHRSGATPRGPGSTERGTNGLTRRPRAGPAPRPRTKSQAADATTPSTSSAREAIAALSGKHTLPPELAAAIRNAADVATAHHRERLVERAESALGAYERGRYQDALRAIKPVAEETPGVAGVRELAGLAAYRCGRWREAVRHLQAVELTNATDYLPVLMDCQRALHKPKKVAELWTELRHSSPEPDVLAEGRIVAAASLADAGDLNGAIAMLATAGAAKALRNPSDRHIRQWYLLGDLYERAGDVPKAREYFERVRRADPEAYDVVDRLGSLGPERRARARGGPARSAEEREAHGPLNGGPRRRRCRRGDRSRCRRCGRRAVGVVVAGAGGAVCGRGGGAVVVVVVGGGAVP